MGSPMASASSSFEFKGHRPPQITGNAGQGDGWGCRRCSAQAFFQQFGQAAVKRRSEHHTKAHEQVAQRDKERNDQQSAQQPGHPRGPAFHKHTDEVKAGQQQRCVQNDSHQKVESNRNGNVAPEHRLANQQTNGAPWAAGAAQEGIHR